MQFRTNVIGSAALILAAQFAAYAGEQASGGGNAAAFATPIRLMAGDSYLGGTRLFPSPVFQDMNADGLSDIVIGDLVGGLTVALRKPGAGAVSFEQDTPLMSADGAPLKFHNW